MIYFRNEWNFAAPAGAPQDGAFHAVSSDGLVFEPQAPYPSDQQHNWTGNYTLVNDTTVRFYGSGQRLWYAESNDAQSWRPFVNIGVIGGDPAALKINDQRWLMIYVGPRYITSVNEGLRTSDAGRRTQDASGPGLYIEVTVDPDGSVTLRKFISE